MERQARNPELELIERKMAENVERRMAALVSAMAQSLSEKDAEIAAAREAAEEAVRATQQPAKVAGTPGSAADEIVVSGDGVGDDK